MRAAVATRASGIVLVICELGIFAAPFSVIEYLPLFFFGALMIWIGYEILAVSCAAYLRGALACRQANLYCGIHC